MPTETLTAEQQETIYVALVEKFLMDGYLPEILVEDTANEIIDLIESIMETN
jgi:hypothetical protein